MVDLERLVAAFETARNDLIDEFEPTGHWTGRLSSSALSTATAISALALYQQHAGGLASTGTDAEQISPKESDGITRAIVSGLRLLANLQNDDGGWGDTDRNDSNIATTMLVRAAFQLTGVPSDRDDLIEHADAYIERAGGVRGLRQRYGKDKTFAVPILMNCALAGLVPWREVSALPFELACVPSSWFRLLRLPVVSYAIPALIAVGQARYHHAPPLNPIMRWIRSRSVGKSLRVLERAQPESGGFLEATPLTSFVVMALASSGKASNPVVRQGIDFLLASQRNDGSWPIDTNLATWVTSLSVDALTEGENACPVECLDWLLECQYREVHPYTEAAPGGWAWTDESGGVPDVDDTSGALLALARLAEDRDDEQLESIRQAAVYGIHWLLQIQNSDGGWPTFCRGWGKLPFDRSGSDLTAHAVRALHVWYQVIELLPHEDDGGHTKLGVAMLSAIQRGLSYLERTQQENGSWLPLWFGNEQEADQSNPVYGTSRVLLAYRDLDQLDRSAARRGLDWLLTAQDLGGGWGGGGCQIQKGKPKGDSSVEETALALTALLSDPQLDQSESTQHLVAKGLACLKTAVEEDRHRECSPIGFYFAKLWYYESLYPMIFSVSALSQAVNKYRPQSVPDDSNETQPSLDAPQALPT